MSMQQCYMSHDLILYLHSHWCNQSLFWRWSLGCAAKSLIIRVNRIVPRQHMLSLPSCQSFEWGTTSCGDIFFQSPWPFDCNSNARHHHEVSMVLAAGRDRHKAPLPRWMSLSGVILNFDSKGNVAVPREHMICSLRAGSWWLSLHWRGVIHSGLWLQAPKHRRCAMLSFPGLAAAS